MPTILKLIGILRFALDDTLSRLEKKKWKGGPRAAFYCVIHHRTFMLGLRSRKVRTVLKVVLQNSCGERGAQG
jgi:hypothetical protein